MFITKFETNGSYQDDQLSETLQLSYGGVQFSYQQQDDKGAKLGGVLAAGWDQTTNKKI